MSKKICCTACRKDMGEIRDAKLRKNIRFICQPCDDRRLEIYAEYDKLKNGKSNDPFEYDKNSVLKDLFGKSGLF